MDTACDLWHANAGHNTGRADGTGTDTYLDRVCTSVGQIDCGIRRSNVAADHLNFREMFFNPANPVEHALGMAMGRIHYDHVNSGLNQRGYTCICICTGANGSASSKTALLVLASERIVLRLLDILDGNQPAQFKVVIHDQDFFNAVTMQQLFHVVQVGTLFHRHQLVLGGHDFRDRRVQAAFKANIHDR